MVDAVCHHCGKPLCREHQMVVALDEAFTPTRLADTVLSTGLDGSAIGFGVHCESCRRAHHGRATLLDGLPK
ncbi:hypothetical protein [Amycolatopsis kentuckyensis]|uniref:hypothetical protein n=1 Tax=Amycolatopsis kentuckyensis TaxID=218823 RepID=UPI00356B28FB